MEPDLAFWLLGGSRIQWLPIAPRLKPISGIPAHEVMCHFIIGHILIEKRQWLMITALWMTPRLKLLPLQSDEVGRDSTIRRYRRLSAPNAIAKPGNGTKAAWVTAATRC